MCLLAVCISYYGQKSQAQHLLFCAIPLSSKWLKPFTAQTAQNYCKGQHSYLSFRLNSIIGWLVCELTIAVHWTKAACVQSKYLMPSQEKGRCLQSLGKLPVNTCFERLSNTATNSTENVPCRQTRRHRLGTKSLRQPQNSQLNLTTVEKPIKIIKKHQDDYIRSNQRSTHFKPSLLSAHFQLLWWKILITHSQRTVYSEQFSPHHQQTGVA